MYVLGDRHKMAPFLHYFPPHVFPVTLTVQLSVMPCQIQRGDGSDGGGDRGAQVGGGGGLTQLCDVSRGLCPNAEL